MASGYQLPIYLQYDNTLDGEQESAEHCTPSQGMSGSSKADYLNQRFDYYAQFQNPAMQQHNNQEQWRNPNHFVAYNQPPTPLQGHQPSFTASTSQPQQQYGSNGAYQPTAVQPSYQQHQQPIPQYAPYVPTNTTSGSGGSPQYGQMLTQGHQQQQSPHQQQQHQQQQQQGYQQQHSNTMNYPTTSQQAMQQQQYGQQQQPPQYHQMGQYGGNTTGYPQQPQYGQPGEASNETPTPYQGSPQQQQQQRQQAPLQHNQFPPPPSGSEEQLTQAQRIQEQLRAMAGSEATVVAPITSTNNEGKATHKDNTTTLSYSASGIERKEDLVNDQKEKKGGGGGLLGFVKMPFSLFGKKNNDNASSTSGSGSPRENKTYNVPSYGSNSTTTPLRQQQKQNFDEEERLLQQMSARLLDEINDMMITLDTEEWSARLALEADEEDQWKDTHAIESACRLSLLEQLQAAAEVQLQQQLKIHQDELCRQHQLQEQQALRQQRERDEQQKVLLDNNIKQQERERELQLQREEDDRRKQQALQRERDELMKQQERERELQSQREQEERRKEQQRVLEQQERQREQEFLQQQQRQQQQQQNASSQPQQAPVLKMNEDGLYALPGGHDPYAAAMAKMETHNSSFDAILNQFEWKAEIKAKQKEKEPPAPAKKVEAAVAETLNPPEPVQAASNEQAPGPQETEEEPTDVATALWGDACNNKPAPKAGLLANFESLMDDF